MQWQTTVSVLGHPHSKKVFPDVQMAPPVFQFEPIASDAVTGLHWKEPGSVFFAAFHEAFAHFDEIPPFSSPGWIVPALSASPH